MTGQETPDTRGLSAEQAAEKLEQVAGVSNRKLSAALLLGAAALRQTPKTCEWVNGFVYTTACGHEWQFIDEGPVENKMQFCMGCGKPVSVQPKEPTR